MKTPKEEHVRFGANYRCERCGGRGYLYLADGQVKDVTDSKKHKKEWKWLTQ